MLKIILIMIGITAVLFLLIFCVVIWILAYICNQLPEDGWNE